MTADTRIPWWPDAPPLPAASGPGAAPLLRMYAPGSRPRAGAIASDHLEVASDWHHHDMHQLVHAFEGAIEVEIEPGRHLIPRQLVAWIPAGVPHRIRHQRVRSGSIFLPAEAVDDPGQRIRTVLASPLMREMIREAMRWQLPGPETPLRELFFATMAGLCAEWIRHDADLFLPTSSDPRLQRALDHTAAHADARLPDVCRHAGMSERSLRRHLKQDTGMSWEAYRQRSRLLQAIALLGETDGPVTEIAARCGFESPSAFAKAFRATMAESPSDYRRRARAA